MKILEQDISEYQELCRTKLGIVVDRDNALDELRELIECMSLVFQPVTREDMDKVQLRRKELGIASNKQKEMRSDK